MATRRDNIEAGREAVRHGQPDFDPEGADSETALVDTLANLMHFDATVHSGPGEGMSTSGFDRALRLARELRSRTVATPR